MDDNLNIELLSAEPKKRRGGHRPGAGRPSVVRENKRRMEMGLEPLPKKPLNKKVRKQKSTAILPENKKARAQEILAEMLGRKSQYIVQKVLDKALDDEDADQMACLKLVMDRVLPADYLSKSKGKGNSISIQIMGMEGTITADTIDDAEYTEVEDDNG